MPLGTSRVLNLFFFLFASKFFIAGLAPDRALNRIWHLDIFTRLAKQRIVLSALTLRANDGPGLATRTGWEHGANDRSQTYQQKTAASRPVGAVSALHRHLCLPQSSSISRVAAGTAGFLHFTQWCERPGARRVVIWASARVGNLARQCNAGREREAAGCLSISRVPRCPTRENVPVPVAPRV